MSESELTHAVERDVYINKQQDSCRSVFVKLEWQVRSSVFVHLLDKNCVPLVCLCQLTFRDSNPELSLEGGINCYKHNLMYF